jgi:uncharacterized protein (TIGR02466 family)
MSLFSLDINVEILKDVKSLNKELLKTCNEIYKKNKTVHKSNDGYQSDRLDIKKYTVFLKLFEKTKDPIYKTLELYNLKNINNINFSLPWININKPGDFNWPHKHLNSHFSLVYYLKVPKKSGDIYFTNPLTEGNLFFLKEFKEYNPYNSSSFNYEPEKNSLIMFPSNLQHAVGRNNSKENRISIAFDINIE